jgi:hypothetical protein
MHDAVHSGTCAGNTAAHSGFQYCHQDGRSAPSLNDHTLSDCRQCSLSDRCALPYNCRLQTHSDRQTARSARCLPQRNSQPSATVTAQRTSRYQNTVYDWRSKLRLSEDKSVVIGGPALPHPNFCPLEEKTAVGHPATLQFTEGAHYFPATKVPI